MNPTILLVADLTVSLLLTETLANKKETDLYREAEQEQLKSEKREAPHLNLQRGSLRYKTCL